MKKNDRLNKVLCSRTLTEEYDYVLSKIRSVTPLAVDKVLVGYRFEHMKRVADISEELLDLYMRDFEKCDGKYNSKITKISKGDYSSLNEIKKKDVLKSVTFLGLIHDIFKFCETSKVDHGELIGRFFKEFCKKNKLKMSGLVKKMYEAVRYHNRKGKKLDNLYYKILCDADVLSHFFPEMFKERSYKIQMTSEEYIKKLDKEMKGYEPQTPFFDILKKKYRRKTTHNMYDKVFKKSDKKAVKQIKAKKESKKKGK